MPYKSSYNNKETPKFTSYNKGGYTGKYKKKNSKHTKRVVLLSVLCALLLIMVGGGIFLLIVSNPSNVFNNTVKPEDLISTSGPEPSSSSLSEMGMLEPQESVDPYGELLQQANMDFMKDRVNILILGIDRNKAREDWGSFRTDTMIVAMCDFNKHSISLLSIPRDCLVHIGPRFKTMNKANTSFGAGGGESGDGYKNAMATISRILGVPVTKYIGFDMTVVKKIVDIIGGVDYNVEFDVQNAGGVTTVRKGQQTLNGTQVLDICRMRHGVAGGDLGRIDNQQKMLFEVIKQMKNKDLLKNLPDIYKAVEENMSTNLDFAQICSMALYAKDLDLGAMQRYTLPTMYLPEIDKTSFLGIDQSEKKKMMKEIFGIDVKTDSNEDGGRIKDLAAQVTQLKSSASSKISSGRSYVNSNSGDIGSSNKTKFSNLVSDLKALINETMYFDLSGGVSDLKSKIHSLDDLMASIKAEVQKKKDAEASPKPSESKPAPSESKPAPSESTPAPSTSS